jgi:Flp pilus assembly protein TadG
MGEAAPRCRAYRHRRRAGEGSTLVEFALVAPIGFLLLLGIIVSGIVVTNFVQLTNAARDGARIAAICGHVANAPMPDGSGLCSDAAIQSYITNHLVAVPLSQTPLIFVCLPDDAAHNQCATLGQQGIHNCQVGRIVEVDMSYDQPLYLPLVTNLFQTKPNGTRLLQASAEATCEQ